MILEINEKMAVFSQCQALRDELTMRVGGLIGFASALRPDGLRWFADVSKEGEVRGCFSYVDYDHTQDEQTMRFRVFMDFYRASGRPGIRSGIRMQAVMYDDALAAKREPIFLHNPANHAWRKVYLRWGAVELAKVHGVVICRMPPSRHGIIEEED